MNITDTNGHYNGVLTNATITSKKVQTTTSDSITIHGKGLMWKDLVQIARYHYNVEPRGKEQILKSRILFDPGSRGWTSTSTQSTSTCTCVLALPGIR